MSRVALVEDHRRLANMIRQALLAAGIETDIFRTLSEASCGVGGGNYAVLIVDRGLPDGDGLAFLQTLRASGHMTPSLILTARDALHDWVHGLETGADDYVTKPFAMSELVARVRALMRRPLAMTSPMRSFADLTLDPGQRVLRCGAHAVLLGSTELQIMLTLLEARGQTVGHAALEHAAWGLGEAVTPNALEVTLHRLRKKLAGIGSTVLLSNIRGAGFALQAHD